jgi:hypothetical protein
MLALVPCCVLKEAPWVSSLPLTEEAILAAILAMFRVYYPALRGRYLLATGAIAMGLVLLRLESPLAPDQLLHTAIVGVSTFLIGTAVGILAAVSTVCLVVVVFLCIERASAAADCKRAVRRF